MERIKTITAQWFAPAILVLALAVITSCDDGLNETGELSGNIQTTGFVVSGTTSSGVLVKYFPELPNDGSAIDLSDGTDFQRFFVNSVMDHAMFLPQPDNSLGFAKFVVGENGQFFEVGSALALDAGSFRIDVKDSDLGVFQDRSTPDNITVFDPKTMDIIGSIDMTDAFIPDDADGNSQDQRYQRFIFRGDDVYAPARVNRSGAGFANQILFHQADVATMSYIGETERMGPAPIGIGNINDMGQNYIDAEGNLYLPDVGVIPGPGAPARVNRVPIGSEDIDPTYTFEPSSQLAPGNFFLPAFLYFKIVPGTNTAVALVNGDVPPRVVEIITEAGGIPNLTGDEIQEITGLLFQSPSARWCELDLNAQTVTVIDGIPSMGILAPGSLFFFEGDVFLPVENAEERGYYRWNPETGVATKAFEITGADLSQVINLENDN
ncbi:MAG: hypothetical protein AAGC64_00095 [Bacteroidota bacterium]